MFCPMPIRTRWHSLADTGRGCAVLRGEAAGGGRLATGEGGRGGEGVRGLLGLLERSLVRIAGCAAVRFAGHGDGHSAKGTVGRVPGWPAVRLVGGSHRHGSQAGGPPRWM